MRNEPVRSRESNVWLRVLQIPLLYAQFVRYQPSPIGKIIALIPMFVLLAALVWLVV